MTTTNDVIDSMRPHFDLDSVPADDRDRVAALIPDPAWADTYVHRNIAGIDDFTVLDFAIAQQENVMLAGPTGSSKSTMFRAYAASRGLPFVLVECNADGRAVRCDAVRVPVE